MLESLFKRGGDEKKSEMSFVDHLEELRWHIVRSLLVVVILAGLIFFNIHWVWDKLIVGPVKSDFISYRAFCKLSHLLHVGDALCMQPVNVKMQTTTFGGQFLGSFSIAFIGAFIVAFPYIFWEFWRFVKPALKTNELKGTRFAIFWVTFFFLLGSAFGYYVLAPFTFNFLASFSISGMGMIQTIPTFNDYIDNLTNIILGCGIAFELPVLAHVLTKIGIVSPAYLRKARRYAIVIILIVAAFITPSPDWISQMLVFIPLMSLYELSIFVSKRAYKEREQKEKEEWS